MIIHSPSASSKTAVTTSTEMTTSVATTHLSAIGCLRTALRVLLSLGLTLDRDGPLYGNSMDGICDIVMFF
jgi:hypothetical protein